MLHESTNLFNLVRRYDGWIVKTLFCGRGWGFVFGKREYLNEEQKLIFGLIVAVFCLQGSRALKVQVHSGN
jgi:hypothetical protein